MKNLQKKLQMIMEGYSGNDFEKLIESSNYDEEIESFKNQIEYMRKAKDEAKAAGRTTDAYDRHINALQKDMENYKKNHQK